MVAVFLAATFSMLVDRELLGCQIIQTDKNSNTVEYKSRQ